MSGFKLTSNVALINARMQANARRVKNEAAFGIQAHAQQSMAEEKHGALRGAHRASAPGESPAVDTGNLTNSMRVQEVSEITTVVGTNAEYAPVLEFGGVKMAARPFLAPAFDAIKPEFEKAMREVANV